MTGNCAKKRQGFTLVEILVVIGLTSFLFFSMFGAYFRIKDLLYEQGSSSQKRSHSFSMLEMILNDLRNLYYERWNPNSFFEGKKNIGHNNLQIDTLNFTSSTLYSNASTMQSRVFSINYFGEEGKDDKIHLVRQESPFIDYKEKTWGIPIPILKDVTHFELQYSGNGSQWQDEWDSKIKRAPPSFVQIKIKWLEGEREKEKMILVQPYIAAY